MTTLPLLAAIGVIEALVYLDRIRTATAKSVWRSALSAFMVATSRIAFIIVGAGAVMRDTPWPLAMLWYVLPATLATVLVHWHLERRNL